MRQFHQSFWRIVITAIVTILTLAIMACLFPQQVLVVDSGPVTADVLVILGGGGGRTEHAADLYRQGAASRLLVTGAGDCQINAALLERRGVPAAAITLEPAALSTLQNAEYSAPLLRKMGVHSAILVTSWYHCRRALACFRHFAPNIKFYSRPTYWDFNAKNPRSEIFNRHVNIEYAKLIGYGILYRVLPF